MPPHSSHLLQPLDVGCFSVLKRKYGRQIEGLMKNHVNHITKAEFFIAFKAAFYETFSDDNVKAGFRGAGLVPHDPDAVISGLDIQLRTPTPPDAGLPDATSWHTQTPNNPTEAVSQSDFIKCRVSKHQGSSPTPILLAIDQLAKGTKAVMHRLTLVEEEVEHLRTANRDLSKRRKAKRSRIRLGGSLTVAEGEDLLDQDDVDIQLGQEMQQHSAHSRASAPRARRCGNCKNTGHNARTCKEYVRPT